MSLTQNKHYKKIFDKNWVNKKAGKYVYVYYLKDDDLGKVLKSQFIYLKIKNEPRQAATLIATLEMVLLKKSDKFKERYDEIVKEFNDKDSKVIKVQDAIDGNPLYIRETCYTRKTVLDLIAPRRVILVPFISTVECSSYEINMMYKEALIKLIDKYGYIEFCIVDYPKPSSYISIVNWLIEEKDQKVIMFHMTNKPKIEISGTSRVSGFKNTDNRDEALCRYAHEVLVVDKQKPKLYNSSDKNGEYTGRKVAYYRRTESDMQEKWKCMLEAYRHDYDCGYVAPH